MHTRPLPQVAPPGKLTHVRPAAHCEQSVAITMFEVCPQKGFPLSSSTKQPHSLPLVWQTAVPAVQ
jgi:hypothetical protein